jgi:hypothetical protein
MRGWGSRGPLADFVLISIVQIKYTMGTIPHFLGDSLQKHLLNFGKSTVEAFIYKKFIRFYNISIM